MAMGRRVGFFVGFPKRRIVFFSLQVHPHQAACRRLNTGKTVS
jgi:hypothetical protein